MVDFPCALSRMHTCHGEIGIGDVKPLSASREMHIRNTSSWTWTCFDLNLLRVYLWRLEIIYLVFIFLLVLIIKMLHSYIIHCTLYSIILLYYYTIIV